MRKTKQGSTLILRMNLEVIDDVMQKQKGQKCYLGVIKEEIDAANKELDVVAKEINYADIVSIKCSSCETERLV